ncbi:hypothetical protein D3C72_1496080 [compost metagenome]
MTMRCGARLLVQGIRAMWPCSISSRRGASGSTAMPKPALTRRTMAEIELTQWTLPSCTPSSWHSAFKAECGCEPRFMVMIGCCASCATVNGTPVSGQSAALPAQPMAMAPLPVLRIWSPVSMSVCSAISSSPCCSCSCRRRVDSDVS